MDTTTTARQRETCETCGGEGSIDGLLVAERNVTERCGRCRGAGMVDIATQAPVAA